jgi:hypothetical protein
MIEKKIAIYSVNFGNYRDELEKGIDTLNFDPRIDYFFYTEQANIKSKYWNVHQVTLNEPPQNSMLNIYRYNSKYFKYHLPENLIDYDIVVWIDSKIIQRRAILPTYDNIINRMEVRKIAFHKHKDRETTKEEIDITIEKKLENKDNVLKFYDKINVNNFELPLIDSCFMMYRNELIVHKFLGKIWETLIEYGLKRDQNVISYAFSFFSEYLTIDDIDLTLGRPMPSGKDILPKEFIEENFKKKKVAILFWGITRSLKYTYPSIAKSILNVLERNGISFDIFVHTYQVQYYNNIRAEEHTTNMDNTQHKYLPYKAIMIDSDTDTRKYLDFPKYHSKKDFFKNDYNTINNAILAFYSKKQVLKMMEKNKNNYDHVMFVRPDCFYYERLPLSNFSFVKKKQIVVPNFHLTDGMNDRFAICSVTDAFIYGNAFDELLVYSKKEFIHPEIFLIYHLTKHDCKVKLIKFNFARIRFNNIMNVRDQIIYERVSGMEGYSGYIIPANLKPYNISQFLVFSIIIFMILGVTIGTLFYNQTNRKNVYVILSLLLISILSFLITISTTSRYDEPLPIFLAVLTILAFVLAFTAFITICVSKLNNKRIIVITFVPYIVWIILFNVFLLKQYISIMSFPDE